MPDDLARAEAVAPQADLAMGLSWEDISEPVATHPLSALAQSHGLPTALEVLAASRTARVCVVLPLALRAGIDAFLASHRVEAGGLLLGRRFRLGDDEAPGAVGHGLAPAAHVVSIDHFVPGRVFEGTGVSLALGSELWDDARGLIDQGFVVVGWVHSHPDLGAFFSGTDRRTQRAFFAQPWQVGLCIDPVRGETAWFHGADSLDSGLACIDC